MNNVKPSDEFQADAINEEGTSDETVTFVPSSLELPEAVQEEMNARFEALERALTAESDRSVAENEATLESTQALNSDEANLTEGLPILSDEMLDEMPTEEEDEDFMAMAPMQPLSLEEAQASVEAMIFMAEKPMSLEKIYNLLSPENEEGEHPTSFSVFQEALTLLRERYKEPTFGFELKEVSGGWQFRTKPHLAKLTQKLAKIQVQRLSAGAMEALTIIAYKQPVLKEEIDKIRGVDSSYFIRGLLDRNLIEMSGRSDLPGRPILYTTTTAFLQLFGINSAKDLPPLHEVENMIPHSQVGHEDDPRIKEMRKLVQDMKSDKTRIDYDPREDERILKEMKEQISAIPVSTPSLDEQRVLEKEAHGA